MFGRSVNEDQKPPVPTSTPNPAPNGAAAQHQAPSGATAPIAASAAQPTASVIGADLAIVGQKINVISQSLVQVDGQIEGDVAGREVIVGQSGRVHGTVTANLVEVRGIVSGAINASAVNLTNSAQVEGDINHQTLTIAEGAQFDGRVRRPEDASVLTPNLDVAAVASASNS